MTRSDWSTYPVTILNRSDVPIGGYVGFIAPLKTGQEVVTSGWQDGTPSYDFYVTERVLDGLITAGIDLFEVEPAESDEAPPPFQG